MKKFFRQFDKIKKDVKLKNIDRFVIREQLENYIKDHPIAENKIDKQSSNLITKIIKPKFAGAILSVLIIFTISTSTVLAAENSLPGDALYSLKVDVIEEVRSQLIFSNKNKLAWEEKRLEKRLEEAKEIQTLKSEIEEEVIVNLNSNIEKQVDAILAAAKKIETSKSDFYSSEVAKNIEKKLSEYSETLDNLGNTAKIKIDNLENEVESDNKKEKKEDEDPSIPEEGKESDYEVEILEKTSPGLSGHYIELELPNGKNIKIREIERQGKIFLELEQGENFTIEKIAWINILKSKLQTGMNKDELQSAIPKECWENNCRIKLNQKYEEFF